MIIGFKFLLNCIEIKYNEKLTIFPEIIKSNFVFITFELSYKLNDAKLAKKGDSLYVDLSIN